MAHVRGSERNAGTPVLGTPAGRAARGGGNASHGARGGHRRRSAVEAGRTVAARHWSSTCGADGAHARNRPRKIRTPGANDGRLHGPRSRAARGGRG